MKILFLGVFSPRSTNVSQYQALERIGCEVFAVDFRANPVTPSGLAAQCKAWNPDLVLFSKCNELDNEVMDVCGDARTVYWYMDPVNGNWAPAVEKMKRADIVYCNIWDAYEAAKEFCNAHHLHEGFDPLVDRLQMQDYFYDVTFIGGLHGDRAEYADCFEHLTGRYGDDHARAVAASKINLNFTSGGASDRVYKIMAAGGFLLTEYWPHMEDDFVDGEDLQVFEGKDDLKENIDFFLRHDLLRRRIASNGYLKVQKFNRTAWAKRIAEDAI
jgi:hypothetical protein